MEDIRAGFEKLFTSSIISRQKKSIPKKEKQQRSKIRRIINKWLGEIRFADEPLQSKKQQLKVTVRSLLLFRKFPKKKNVHLTETKEFEDQKVHMDKGKYELKEGQRDKLHQDIDIGRYISKTETLNVRHTSLNVNTIQWMDESFDDEDALQTRDFQKFLNEAMDLNQETLKLLEDAVKLQNQLKAFHAKKKKDVPEAYKQRIISILNTTVKRQDAIAADAMDYYAYVSKGVEQYIQDNMGALSSSDNQGIGQLLQSLFEGIEAIKSGYNSEDGFNRAMNKQKIDVDEIENLLNSAIDALYENDSISLMAREIEEFVFKTGVLPPPDFMPEAPLPPILVIENFYRKNKTIVDFYRQNNGIDFDELDRKARDAYAGENTEFIREAMTAVDDFADGKISNLGFDEKADMIFKRFIDDLNLDASTVNMMKELRKDPSTENYVKILDLAMKSILEMWPSLMRRL